MLAKRQSLFAHTVSPPWRRAYNVSARWRPRKGGRHDPTTGGAAGGDRPLVGSGHTRRHSHTFRTGCALATGYCPGGIDPAVRRLRPGRRRLLDSGLVRGHPRGTPRWLLFIEGVVSILAGLIALFLPGLTAILLLYLIAAWAIVTGISEIAMAIRLRKEISGEWALIVGGAFSVLFGVILAVVGPVVGLISLIWLIGFYAVAFGVLMLVTAFSVRGGDSGGPSRPSRVV